jgi:hypothetical protein
MVLVLKPGDRVRVTSWIRVPMYQERDKGTVTSGPHPYPSGATYYRVTMDKTAPVGAIIFLPDEIEADL